MDTLGRVGYHEFHETILSGFAQQGSDIRGRHDAAVRVVNNAVVAIAVVPQLFEVRNLRVREARVTVFVRREAVVLVRSLPVVGNCGFRKLCR